MRWQRRERSRNLEDRRAAGGRRGRISFPGTRGGARLPLPTGRGGRLSLTSVLLIVGAMYFFGIDPMVLLGGAGGLGPGTSTQVGGGLPPVGAPRSTPEEERRVDFVSFVLDDLQTTWHELLPDYRDAKLVLFREATRSGCGVGQSEMGPFYCPADGKVYIDLAFYDELHARFGAPGDFAQAYVLAHEIGHHIQAVRGIERDVRARQRRSPGQANALSVRMELQADCLAGVWGHRAGTRGVLEPGDIEEGLTAAAAIGDDRIQRMSGRGVHPESWTHGSSDQRQRWLRRGLETGLIESCDTFE
jgi:predicted metalloprotease